MRAGQLVLGILMVGAGIVWLLQGLRVIPGSFMTGSHFWAVTGAVLIILGVPVLALGARGPGTGRRG